MSVVIIGAGAAGLSCLDTLCAISPQAKITVISSEDHHPYNRSLLLDYLGNSLTEQELIIARPDDYPANVRFILGQKAERIDVQKKVLCLSDGEELSYDKLLIAVGADAIEPKYYAEGRGAFTLRYLDDAKKIAAAAKGRSVVLGGGFVGIKTACALLEQKIKTDLVIASRYPLAMVLDEASARYVEKDLVELGIRIRAREDAVDISLHKKDFKVYLSSGIALETHAVVVCKGFKPSVDLAKVSGIKVNEGISVNEYLETSAPDVFAAGDCCETMDLAHNKIKTSSLWPAAMEQGNFAALNMSGAGVSYPGGVAVNSLNTKVFHLVTAGILKGEPGLRVYEKYMPFRKQFRKIALRGDVPVGMAFYNCPKDAGLIINLIKKAIPLTVNPEKLVNDDITLSP